MGSYFSQTSEVLPDKNEVTPVLQTSKEENVVLPNKCLRDFVVWAKLDVKPQYRMEQSYLDLVERLECDANDNIMISREDFIDRYGKLESMLYTLGQTSYLVTLSKLTLFQS